MTVNRQDLIPFLKAYLDLTRAHFLFVWPVLGVSGLALAFMDYGGFDPVLALKVVVIAILGFEAGLVLNDYVDRDIDRKDVDRQGLTGYWRPFGTRPLPAGIVPPARALFLFFFLAGAAGTIILTIDPPHSVYLLVLLVYCYLAELFYQVKKRHQATPIAQLAGRTDLALFPVAGYLSYGTPDATAFLYFLFLYPWAEAHLGVNDLADIENDRARGLFTIPLLYGVDGSLLWIAGFSALHLLVAPFFLWNRGLIPLIGSLVGASLIIMANIRILRNRSPASALGALPFFHGALIVYAASIIAALFF